MLMQSANNPWTFYQVDNAKQQANKTQEAPEVLQNRLIQRAFVTRPSVTEAALRDLRHMQQLFGKRELSHDTFESALRAQQLPEAIRQAFDKKATQPQTETHQAVDGALIGTGMASPLAGLISGMGAPFMGLLAGALPVVTASMMSVKDFATGSLKWAQRVNRTSKTEAGDKASSNKERPAAHGWQTLFNRQAQAPEATQSETFSKVAQKATGSSKKPWLG